MRPATIDPETRFFSRDGLGVNVPASDPLIARFAEACGATSPLDLRVDLADGGVFVG